MSNACLNRALQTLARRDHSCTELSQKLKAHGFTNQEIQNAIEECRRLGYLDDDRFAGIYLHQLQRKGNGIHKIKQKLYAKGIPKEIVTNCIASHCTDQIQLDTCRRVLLKKIKYLKGNNKPDDIRPKLQRFLFGRGFSSHIIHQAMEETMARHDE